MPEHAYGEGYGANPIGSGRYMLEQWDRGQQVILKANPDYYGEAPKIERVVAVFMEEDASLAAAQSGQVDVAYTSATFAAQQPAGYDLLNCASVDSRGISLPTIPAGAKKTDEKGEAAAGNDVTCDVAVRQAINYAINKEALAKVAFSGYAFPSEGPLPQGVDYAVKLGPWPYNPKKAKELLAEAGYPNGFETTLWSAYNHTTGQKVIQFIQQQLAQVGIKAQVQALEAGQRVEKVESHQDAATAPVRLYYTGWSSSTGEADWGLRPLFAGDKTPPSMYNISYYKNPTVDADIMKALGTTDRAEKTKLYTEVQEEIWKDAPWAFLVTEKLLYATSKKLTGMYVMPDANYFFEEIDLQ